MTYEQQRQDYVAALDWVARLMAQTAAEQLGRPTPCTEFTVRALLGHLVGTARRGLGTADGTSTRGVPHVVTDVPDAELAAEYARLAARLGPAWSRRTGQQPVTAPWGRCSALDAVRGFTVETLTHGWDLAVATGQPADALEPVAQRCLALAPDVVPDRLRGVMYDEPVDSDATIPATERLARLLGHRRL
ncbi:TIGR03086 family protein [Actinocatenispora thailandica]|uniref:TIGR03086 family protein n=1 Tax=Actinocatenispora thailandica TaxID=227318 RepID=A0A7R7DKU4_9ACTN|nr:TIGR03086 family metal-binding protein [Actinocatenispora thailandica]BCJ33448.1 TIGR03086 family protein [Actinocatenispora thailandica]